MADLLKEIMLVYVSVEGNGIGGNTGNNNKFYKMELFSDGSLIKTYGRIGENGKILNSNGGEREFEKIKREKLKKGYVELEVESNSGSVESNQKRNLEDIVLSQIEYKDDESKNLLKYLVQQNIHNVISNTKIKFDVKTGLFKTPLGIIKKEAVLKAKDILDEIKLFLSKNDFNKLNNSSRKTFITLNENYFTIIPTKLANLRDINSLLINVNRILDQESICDSLLTSLDTFEQDKNLQLKDKKTDDTIYFNTKVELLKDKKIFDKIVQKFEKSKNDSHGSYINSSKIKNIYKIYIDKENKEFDDKIGNVMELWHGTKVCNLLSILKTSLLMPKYSPGSVTGYMFGQGLYFSDQSTKSLNYCDGMYWNNSKKGKYIYMFLCSIAMGNYQVPSNSTSKKPDKGYDSYWAKPGKSGIRNNEMIIFDNKQIRLDYLLEIQI